MEAPHRATGTILSPARREEHIHRDLALCGLRREDLEPWGTALLEHCSIPQVGRVVRLLLEATGHRKRLLMIDTEGCRHGVPPINELLKDLQRIGWRVERREGDAEA